VVLTELIKSLIPHKIKRIMAILMARVRQGLRGLFCRDDFRMSRWETMRLTLLPGCTHTRSPLLKRRIELTDPFWYLRCYRELFDDQMYKFHANRQAPLIIDCGANIGMSVIYFKYLYPDARIIAFEPDPEIFDVLVRNVRTFQLTDTTLHQKALWNREAELAFMPNGSVGGKLVANRNGDRVIYVQAVPLRGYLNEKVDCLKIDIEGAEYEVIKDCQEHLANVDYLFVEYHSKQNEPQTLHEILQIMQNAGFRYHLKEANPVQHPFVSKGYKGPFDLQLNVFGFREHSL
jgi:FkbM family methyltransferase